MVHYYALQTHMDRVGLEKALATLGIKSAMEFDKNEDVIYAMSIEPFSLESFDTDELIAELESRGYLVEEDR